MPLGAVLEAVGDRGYGILLILVTLPFLLPVSVPGMSTPLGLVAAIVGGQLAAGLQPWLPPVLLRRELPARFLTRVLAGASRVVNALEYVLRPRLAWLAESGLFRRFAALLLAVAGLLLALPLPIPLTNTLPAWTILLLAAGGLERDGLFLLAGCAAFALTAAFFVALAFGGAEVIERLRHLFFG